MNFDTMTFEQAYAELERTVKQLESGEFSLEESVRLYELGRKLSQLCQTKLEHAALRVRSVDELDSNLD